MILVEKNLRRPEQFAFAATLKYGLALQPCPTVKHSSRFGGKLRRTRVTLAIGIAFAAILLFPTALASGTSHGTIPVPLAAYHIIGKITV